MKIIQQVLFVLGIVFILISIWSRQLFGCGFETLMTGLLLFSVGVALWISNQSEV